MNVGDKVKITLEGTIALEQDGDGEYLVKVKGNRTNVYLSPGAAGVESFEKIVRPYEVGDIVRGAGGNEWLLARDGYVVVKCGEFAPEDARGLYHEYDGSLENTFPADDEFIELVQAAA